MKYPCTILKGEYASSECVSIAVSHQNVNQDTGAKMIHLAPNTRSKIISKTIASGNGIANYRGLVEIKKEAVNSYSHVKCDSLFLNKESNNSHCCLQLNEI
ncbi:SufD family Fe-S cluster assembly protein [bacterium]|nr:SufD family Fe-S cluster assembly protein [bacterium]